jgi:putative peptide zinc metalloprotease protein
LAHAEPIYRFRQELIVSATGDSYVIKDPERGTYTKLGAAELLVAQYFDGASSLEQIKEKLERERQVIAPLDKLERFRERLHGMQVILAPGEEVAPMDRGLGMAQGPLESLFVIRIPIELNPDAMLTRLYWATRFLFTRGFVAFTVLLLAAAVWIWISEWETLWAQMRTLGSLSGVALLFLAYTVSVSIHELAHGLTTKAFGGQVPRMGAFLYYFLPACYTDVSDAWLFPEKRHRALVVLAGAYATYVLCFLATLVWRILPPGTLASQVACAFMVLNLFGATRTLIPFFKGDGYLLLSDALDLPNLRQKSFGYAGAWLKRAARLSREPLPEATPREHRIYLAYAAGTTVFSTALLLSVAYFLGRWLLGWVSGLVS